MASLPSVIVNYLYVRSPFRCPDEADAPLLIDTDAVLPLPIIFQSFESVAGRYLQVVKDRGPVQLRQLAKGRPLNVHPPPHAFTLEERLRVFALEAFDSHV
jgi:hypothetical protein